MKEDILKEANVLTKKEIENAKKNRENKRKQRKDAISIIELNDKIGIGVGSKPLNSSQMERLHDIENTIDKHTNEKMLSGKRIIIASVILFISTVLIKTALTKNSNPKISLSENMKATEANTVITVEMDKNTNKLDYNIESIMLNLGNKCLVLNNINWFREDLNIDVDNYVIEDKSYKISKELNMCNIDITKDSVYMQYKNMENTASKELIYSVNKPSELQIDILKKSDSRTYLNSTPINLKICRNSYDNSFIYLSEQLGGGKLTDSDLVDTLDKIEGSIRTYEGNDGQIIIKFGGYNRVRVDNMVELGDSPEIVYDKDNDILRVRNKNEQMDYIYICGIDNEVVKCSASDLVASTQENIYLHKDFDIEGSAGYKVFGIEASQGLYIFKFNGKAYQSLINNVLEQLGYDTNIKLGIKKVQTVVPVKLE